MHQVIPRKSIALVAIAAALSLTACKKDPVTENPQPKPTPATQIKKVSTADAVLEFTYADNRLRSIRTNADGVTNGEALTYNIAYADDNTRISALTSGNGNRIVPTYSNGQLSTVSFYDGQTGESMTARYEFENTQLKAITVGVDGMDVLKLSYEYNAEGNVRRMTNWILNPLSGELQPDGHTDYTYDNKTNPLHAHKQLLYLLLQNTARFNTTSETEFDEQNQPGEKTEYTYQYNNQNLPQSAAVKTTAPGEAPVMSTITFLYQ